MTDFKIGDLSCKYGTLHHSSAAPVPAVGFVPHPILGPVPICAACYRVGGPGPSPNHAVKVAGLSAMNVAALEDVFSPQIGDKTIELTKTTAVFHIDGAAKFVREVTAAIPVRGHPRASLHAVARKLEAAA